MREAARPSRTSQVVRFADFEVDLHAGQLRKNLTRIRLQDQPFRVLAVLLQHPGEVVTREELRHRLWHSDTFVDFDNSLNTAINKIREALGDSAETPRFVETIPRRGYRFIAAVHSEAQEKPIVPATSRKTVLLGAIAILVAVAVASGLFWLSRQKRMLTEKDTIVLGDFTNLTGDPVFDGTLREGLAVQLAQSPFLSLVSEEEIHQTLSMMRQPPDVRLTPAITLEVCQRMNSRAALGGSIALIGTRYDLILKAVNCANREALVSTESQANDKSHVLDALGKAASEMRRKLGESSNTLQRYNTPLAQATTPSLEALQAYSLAFKKSFAERLPLLQRATELDPNFAIAQVALSNSYTIIGESALAAENARKAYELRAGVSERERLQIEALYHFYATGNLFMAQRASELGVRTYPRDRGFHEYLATDLKDFGQYEAALQEFLEALRLAPRNPFAYREVAFAYLLLNQVEKAEATAEQARTRGLDSDLPAVLYEIAFYRGDNAEMARQVVNAANNPHYERLLLALEADTAAYFGHLGEAREFSRQAVESAKRAGDQGTATEYSAVSALREALLGNAGAARQQAAIVSKHTFGRRDASYAVALALAYAGDASRAGSMADSLTKRYPHDTDIKFNHLPTLRAKLALGHANPQQALDILMVAAPYELGITSLTMYNWPNMYPVYVRGEAYLAAHKGGEAAAEFQKILDHRGIVRNEPIGALAHLQLGRAYALQGDTTKARSAYQDFLTLWKDADPDILILKEAKAEYAKLQ
jgi:DNA-binding winged helix-turn-helix (wHTH) protein/tetratricopeptide (TPR) repeat protein